MYSRLPGVKPITNVPCREPFGDARHFPDYRYLTALSLKRRCPRIHDVDKRSLKWGQRRIVALHMAMTSLVQYFHQSRQAAQALWQACRPQSTEIANQSNNWMLCIVGKNILSLSDRFCVTSKRYAFGSSRFLIIEEQRIASYLPDTVHVASVPEVLQRDSPPLGDSIAQRLSHMVVRSRGLTSQVGQVLCIPFAFLSIQKASVPVSLISRSD